MTKVVYGILPTLPRANAVLRAFGESGIRGKAIDAKKTRGHLPLRQLPLAATLYLRGAIIGGLATGAMTMGLGSLVSFMRSGADASPTFALMFGAFGALFGALAGALSYAAVRKRAIVDLEEKLEDGVVVVAQVQAPDVDQAQADLRDHGAELVGAS